MPRPLPETPGAVGFVSKPTRGWLHPDKLISKEGISYAVRYIGCLEVRVSMKSLDFETRSQIAKECISRVCEAAGLKTADKKRRPDKRVLRSIADSPNMDHAGDNVKLNISSGGLVLSALDSGRAIARHDMPRISFASGGDTDTLDFVAYVAKDLRDCRACYVLECGGGLAQDVISTIGQAFELRFQQYIANSDIVRDYYNDLPGKIPPEVGSEPPPVPPLPNQELLDNSNNRAVAEPAAVVSNLIDLSTEVAPPAVAGDVEHNYVNAVRDVFDMQPFGTVMRVALQKEPWFHGPISRKHAENLLVKVIGYFLLWALHILSHQLMWLQKDTEGRGKSYVFDVAHLDRDGDFLVRESQGSWGQYVLTGMQGGTKKHLLLVDPEGVVRTKDRMFESVSHLINYHCTNHLPIISAESVLVLQNPVYRT